MNNELRNVAENMRELGLGALTHANRHAAYQDIVNDKWAELSVLQAAHAAEILIKAKIAEEHPLLIFEKFPKDLDVGDTDIVSMEDRTLMMIRDRGHALTIDIDSLEKDNVVVNYFVPKICNKEMVKALPGINSSSITKNGAVGTFDLKKGDIKKIFDFIGKVPTDMDMPARTEQYNTKLCLLFPYVRL